MNRKDNSGGAYRYLGYAGHMYAFRRRPRSLNDPQKKCFSVRISRPRAQAQLHTYLSFHSGPV
ncbi:hypothetical protein M413DRAFT_445439 [Hebeloma cylindrosporum]|uniref:Uncharacterized protein n=1 Tax=Hebeloma cylindrosporum TaxID=76867 RepID=A0A0C2XUU0_HEBCY|nr:hypothetical protein M413DRAFT_445439 [Hebeloma cylindrosporum h7]